MLYTLKLSTNIQYSYVQEFRIVKVNTLIFKVDIKVLVVPTESGSGQQVRTWLVSYVCFVFLCHCYVYTYLLTLNLHLSHICNAH